MASTYPNERRLFRICVLLSSLFWLVLIGGTLGIALLYVMAGAIFALFAQSAFISHVRGTGVRVTRAQLPELHARVERCCRALEVTEPPEVYVLNAHGALNALAARFLRRHYVVLYSDVVDKLADCPGALDFYIGHELGHIARGHLSWAPFLWPARMLPLLGPAYARAREYTCDLHGLACCADPNDALRGLAVLAAGGQSARELDVAKFAGQSDWAGGFWMSFHELISSYPWLTKRARRVMAAAGMQTAPIPGRHLLAWPLALIVPPVGGPAPAAALIPVAVLGMVAAIAIPNFVKFQQRAQAAQVGAMREQLQSAATRYIEARGELPPDLAALGIEPPSGASHVSAIEINDRGFELVVTSPLDAALGARVALTPYVEDGALLWTCGESIQPALRRAVCGESASPPASAAETEAEAEAPEPERAPAEPAPSAPDPDGAVHGRWRPLSPEASGYRELSFGAAGSVVVTLADGRKALGTFELDERSVSIEVSAPDGPQSARYDVVQSGKGTLLRPAQGGSFYARN